MCEIAIFLGSAVAKPTLKQLLEVLSEVAVEWHMLGVYLDIPRGVLNSIEADCRNVKHRLMAMLDKWLSLYPSKDWRDIDIALRSNDLNNIAEAVTEKYMCCRAESSSGTHIMLVYLYSTVYTCILMFTLLPVLFRHHQSTTTTAATTTTR